MGNLSEFFNFENIGNKIKNYAKWYCWVTILLIWISTPITFVILVSDNWTKHLAWIPFLVAIVGPIVVWIGSWGMYAFGEYVEDIHAIRQQLGKIQSIDKSLQAIVQPIIDGTNGKVKSAAEEVTKPQAVTLAKPKAEESTKPEKTASDNRVEEKKAKGLVIKKQKSLSEKLAYALMFETDDGMIAYLRSIEDETVQNILKTPKHLIREQIKNLLATII